MSLLNIETMLSPQASYTDLAGKAALAWEVDEHSALIDIAKKCNIDTQTYEPIGIRLSLSGQGFSLNLYLAKRTREPSGKRRVKSVLTNMTHNDFYQFAQNLNIALFNPYEEYDKLYEYEGEDNLSEVILS
ncbi:hypothetical protein [Mucilaginibacter sp. L3T2-6]|uniref:hypothetical protein n=1 Tax=Mucilaginibacter sp. L3T2-6 TaxID=3062491 RepID=UPI00267662AC|nr:hypothetical protein [Mucilaginibacter sp. L3T2-6]MDO3643849.1 hypothetical protein [Mucilaginibacter sp. L3T2-6]MDV6216300.1 hypothetical protein [Mucilaginibacter sp. L3T2-6]